MDSQHGTARWVSAVSNSVMSVLKGCVDREMVTFSGITYFGR